MIFKNIPNAFRVVYSSYWYVLISLLITFLLFAINVAVQNYAVLLTSFSWKYLFSLMVSTFSVFSVFVSTTLVLIALFGAIVFTFSVFLIKRQLATGLSAGSGGILVAILAPACPSCALGAVSLVSFTGIIAYLPFHGTELGVLGILVLFASIIYLSSKVMGVCEIKKEKN